MSPEFETVFVPNRTEPQRTDFYVVTVIVPFSGKRPKHWFDTLKAFNQEKAKFRPSAEFD